MTTNDGLFGRNATVDVTRKTVARLPRFASSASSALSWGNSKPDVGHVKPNTTRAVPGHYLWAIFLATRGEGNLIVMASLSNFSVGKLGSNPILVGSFPKLDLYKKRRRIFRQGDVPKNFRVNLGRGHSQA